MCIRDSVNVTTAATGDQPDPSTAGDDLDETIVVDNIADLVTEKSLISGNPTPLEGESVTFQIVVTNNGAAQATGVSLVDQLPAGITFTGSTVTQGTYNASTGLWNIGTINEGDDAIITLTGTVDASLGGTTITNITTAATGDQVDPTTAGDDLDESVEVPVIADLGIAKSIVGEPVLTELGNFVVTYQVVVENTGNVDLAQLSLIEDLASQFGSAYIDAGNLILAAGPSLPGSTITLDSAGWNGSTIIELVDTSATNELVVGDSFTLQFDVEIDPREVADTLVNQVDGEANAVDANGDPILDSTGNPITAEDASDSGADAGSSNAGSPDDLGTSDDPTLFDPPEVPLGEISGTVFQDDNGDGVQGAGEGGIAGVEIILTGTDIFGNPVEITTFTDANGNYTFDNLVAGNYSVTQVQPEGFDDGIDNGDSSFTIADDMFSNIQLGFGEAFNNNTFAEQARGATGNPPRFQGLPRITASQIGSLLSSFSGSPGPIYSGVPINGNADPLSLDSGRAVTGGYATPTESEAGDCCECDPCGEVIVDPCAEVMDACDPCGEVVDPCGQPIQEILNDGCGCGPMTPYGQVPVEYMGETVIGDLSDSGSEGDIETAENQPAAENDLELSQNESAQELTFLEKMASWLLPTSFNKS